MRPHPIRGWAWVDCQGGWRGRTAHGAPCGAESASPGTGRSRKWLPPSPASGSITCPTLDLGSLAIGPGSLSGGPSCTDQMRRVPCPSSRIPRSARTVDRQTAPPRTRPRGATTASPRSPIPRAAQPGRDIRCSGTCAWTSRPMRRIRLFLANKRYLTETRSPMEETGFLPARNRLLAAGAAERTTRSLTIGTSSAAH